MDGTSLSTLSLLIRDWLLSDVRSLFVTPLFAMLFSATQFEADTSFSTLFSFLTGTNEVAFILTLLGIK
jgi:hypothetical protein